MTKLSGRVAILDANGSVIGTRDLGPVPVEVKPGLVLPLDEVRENLAEGERHGAPVYSVRSGKAVATFPKEPIPVDPPSIEERLAALEAAVFQK